MLHSIRTSFLASLLIKVVLVTWVAASITFAVMHATPGTYADLLLSDLAQYGLTAERRAEIIAVYGFDKPLWQQYLLYLSKVFHGDLGMSYALAQPVLDLILAQLTPTLYLAGSAIVLSLGIAILVAIATLRAGRFGRMLSSICEVVVVSIPNFWLGLILLTWLSFRLGWFPASGAGSFASLVLPALTLGIPMAGTFVQILRPELQKEINAPYFITARARGRGFHAVVLRHALLHAILPVLTLSASYFAILISGSVIVENLFGRPGIGRLMLNAVLVKDVPLVSGIVILSAVTFVVINQSVDRLILWIDPRIERH